MIPDPILCDMCHARWNKNLPLKVEVKFIYDVQRQVTYGYCIHKFEEIELTNLNLDYIEYLAKKKNLI